MPQIANGRVATNGTGSISFVYKSQTFSASGSTPTTALTVTGTNIGNGVPLFAGQNSNVGNVVLNFNTLKAGNFITFDTSSAPGEIIINGTAGGGSGATTFIQLTDTPEHYTPYSIVYSTYNGISYVPAPSTPSTFLYFNGTGFSFQSVVTSIAATGTAGQIVVSNSPITSTGTFNIALSSYGTAGTYNTVVVDMFGRVQSGTLAGTDSITLVGDVLANGITGTNITATLASIGTAGTYINFSVNTKGLVTSARSLTLSDLETLGAAPITSPNFLGTPTTVTPNISSNNTDIPTTAWVNEQNYLVAPITMTGDVYGTSTGNTGNIAVTLNTIVLAGTYTSVTVNSKGLVVAGTSGGGGGGVTLVAARSSTLSVSGSPITASGTFDIELATVGSPGTYGAVVTDTYGRVVGSSTITYAMLPTEIQTQIFPFSFAAVPAANVDIIVPIVQNTTIPNGLTNTKAYALVGATSGPSVFTLSYIRSGTQTTIGTISFATSANTGTVSYALGAALSLVVGDILVMNTPEVADSTLSNVGISIYALKV